MGTIPLPVNQTFNGGLAFGITQIGTGRAGLFRINRSNSTSSAFEITTNGGASALRTTTTGTGAAGTFINHNQDSNAPALEVLGNGFGVTANFQSLHPLTGGEGFLFHYQGTGLNTEFKSFNNSGGGIVSEIQGQNRAAGEFRNLSTTGSGLTVQSNGGPGIRVRTLSTGWPGEFIGQARGVRITTSPGGIGLQVVNGSKNAVVSTVTGARALYSEEATEVWFADYGFGKLENGRARILIDPGFAQTVTLEEPYHVFVQAYGRAELYVAERTSLGFIVMLKDGDPTVEFGYRVLAKRSGFENQRLERAPWADKSP